MQIDRLVLFMFFERGDDRNFYSFDNLLKMSTTSITVPSDKGYYPPTFVKNCYCIFRQDAFI